MLVAGLGLAVVARYLLLPADELTGDLDQFVLWVHGIATTPLGHAYDTNVSFPPVMVYIWWLLAALQPVFRTATDASDAPIRILMKLPATVADFGLAALAGYVLRFSPRWAIVAALGLVLHPAILDISTWWGQYESIYVLFGLLAFVLAARDRPNLAAVALAFAVLTKPQAIPFLVPFAAWFLARYGMGQTARYAIVGLATILVLWLPFLPFGGPINYLHNLADYQNQTYAVLSLRAWNPWWIFQTMYGGGDFVGDAAAVVGPVTLRMLGIVVTAFLEAVVVIAVYRHPTPRSLALGLAASSLVAFSALTTMHERYAFPALVFLALWLPERTVRWTWVAFGVAFTANLFAAIPPTDAVRTLLPIGGIVGIVGSAVMTAVTVVTLALVLRPPVREDAASRAPIRSTAPA
jgi:Gpi18-like mannosyltransferase